MSDIDNKTELSITLLRNNNARDVRNVINHLHDLYIFISNSEKLPRLTRII